MNRATFRQFVTVVAGIAAITVGLLGCHHAEAVKPVARSETPPIVIDDAFRERVIGLDLDVLEDKSGALTFEDVRSPDHAARFLPSTKAAPNFGYTKSAYWARFSLADERDAAKRASGDALELTLAYAITDFAELWCENAAGAEVVHARAGDHVLLAEWPSTYREPSFAIPAAARTCFLRVESGASMQFPLTLRTRDAFASHRLSDNAMQCLYFGALLVMIAYNGLVAVSSRSLAYGFYTLFLLSYGLIQCALGGFGYAFLWPDAVGWADRAAPLFIASCALTSIPFAALLLDLPRTSPRFWLLARVTLALFSLHVCVMGFLPYSLATRAVLAIAPLWAFVLLGSGVLQSWRGMRVAKLYLAAWIIFIVGTLVNMLRAVGVLPTNAFMVNAHQVGSAIEFVLLSFALADRIKTLQAEVATQANLAAQNAELARAATQRALDEQARTNSELKRLDALKDEFLANTSHELRTPLNGVIGLADSVADAGTTFQPRFVRVSATILASGKRLDRLISDVMDFAKVKSGHMSVEFTGVDLHAAVAEAIMVLSGTVGEKDVTLVNDIGQAFPLARADETRFSQVLLHVIGNAIKFTENGEVRVAATRDGEKLVLVVADTGPGMDEATVARLFSAFEQGDGTATRTQGGTGLGLAFVQQLMALQIGSVRVDSAPNLGTRVTLTLAIAPPAIQASRRQSVTRFKSVPPGAHAAIAARTSILAIPRLGALPGVMLKAPQISVPPSLAMRRKASSGAERLPHSNEIRVLIADDEEANLDRLRLDFEHTKYELICVTDGQAAVDAFKKEGPFDLILLDVMMPRLDGLGACRAIRELAGAHEVPIVLVTAKRETKDMQAGFEAGANDYLTKPYVRQELLERARTHIGTARMARAVQHFVPKEFAALLGHTRVDQIALGDCGEKNLTILFLDIEGYTKAAEKMSSRQIFEWLNGQFQELVPAIRAHGGFVDKFIGDAMMALFPKDALAAVDAASEAMQRLRLKYPTARVGIGLHHGLTMVGAVGDRGRFSPTVVSDAVNVAARLESLTRRFDSRVLLSTDVLTQAEMRPADRTRYLGTFCVKGRAKPVGIHELLDAEDPVTAAEKRAAAPLLQGITNALEAGDVAGACGLAAEATALFPGDVVLAFYLLTLTNMIANERSYSGAIVFQDK